MAILIMLILPIHGHAACFHVFVSSLISFFSVVWFSEYRSFTSLVKFIPRYFIFLVAISSGIFSWFLFLIFHCWCQECLWFLNIDLVSTVLPNSFIRSSRFLVESIGFSFFYINKMWCIHTMNYLCLKGNFWNRLQQRWTLKSLC